MSLSKQTLQKSEKITIQKENSISDLRNLSANNKIKDYADTTRKFYYQSSVPPQSKYSKSKNLVVSGISDNTNKVHNQNLLVESGDHQKEVDYGKHQRVEHNENLQLDSRQNEQHSGFHQKRNASRAEHVERHSAVIV